MEFQTKIEEPIYSKNKAIRKVNKVIKWKEKKVLYLKKKSRTHSWANPYWLNPSESWRFFLLFIKSLLINRNDEEKGSSLAKMEITRIISREFLWRSLPWLEQHHWDILIFRYFHIKFYCVANIKAIKLIKKSKYIFLKTKNSQKWTIALAKV